jgi:hypothetical protein
MVAGIREPNTMHSLPGRNLRERAARYRELALKAEAAGAHVQTETMRVAWEKIARDWNELALEVERHLDSAAYRSSVSDDANENASGLRNSLAGRVH